MICHMRWLIVGKGKTIGIVASFFCEGVAILGGNDVVEKMELLTAS